MAKHIEKISVIVPTKDRLHHLKRMLPHYLRQSEVGEVIVVIDGSTDGTHEFLQDYCKREPRVRYLDNGTNRGIPYTKNRGIQAAKCPYIFIGEDDLELGDNFFQTLFAHLQSTKADIMCGRNIFRREDETAEEAIHRTDRMRGEVINKKTIEINTSMRLLGDTFQVMSAAPVLGRAEIFREVGFDERYKVNFWREETDFQIGVQEHGYKLASCPHALCYNYVIEKDFGGVHSAHGLKRVTWVTINNWRFIRKHQQFIAANFEIGNSYTYIIKFTLLKLFVELAVPRLSKIKRKLVRAR